MHRQPELDPEQLDQLPENDNQTPAEHERDEYGRWLDELDDRGWTSW